MTEPEQFDSALLATRIRAECLRRGWHVGELAQKAGVSRTTIYHLERGHTQRIRAATIKAIAEALGLSVDELLGAPTGRPKPSTRSGGDEEKARAFDRATNPAVEEVARERPEIFEGWSENDWAELYSEFGVGGALTPLGVLKEAESINRKRETIRQLQIVLETHLRPVAEEVIETFYRMVQVEPRKTKEPPAEPPR
jgi:transcriptional regulator with XRE-family HTH domain